jgi:ribosomal protein S18 acetylase RimI-like enzyme
MSNDLKLRFSYSRFDEQSWSICEMTRSLPEPKVEFGKVSDAGRCVEILTRAFIHDPAARWLYPAESQYRQFFPEFVRVFAGNAFQSGAVEILGEFAAALWLAPGSHPDDAALTELFERSIAAPHRDSVLMVFEQMDHYHPQQPHWHLPLIGVDPRRQRRGHGSALLQSMLSRLDEEQIPAYLEATSAENVALYERHGFEVTGVIQAGASPSIFPMFRNPK